jgi:hypothetical protein
MSYLVMFPRSFMALNYIKMCNLEINILIFPITCHVDV